ncbi:MAG TPA: GH1 family beta-glucosidase [Acidimicrobiia bacterium]|jgi:beta-glucosidase
MSVPGNFTWGVSTSAYQIEGGRNEGGKGESIWDRFADEGRIPESGDVACDHYHRWRDDIALMADLGVTGYRFSIAWTRILPAGASEVSNDGLDFYQRLVDALLDNGIEPWPTLYHWDLPAVLQDRGGWPARDTAEAFAGYAAVVGEALGDRVRTWITHNEPWVATFLGHLEGVFAPGIRDWGAALAAGHHILLSHGLATQALRSTVPHASIGIAIDCRPSYPASDSEADRTAQRHFDGFRNRWFFDPVFGLGYPEDIVATYRDRGRFVGELPFVVEGDMETIAQPIDFLGLNYYTSIGISAPDDESEDSGVPPGPNPPPGHTEMGWAITPSALTDYLSHLDTVYSPPAIVITENGASYSDGPDEHGVVDDERRSEYLRLHIAAVESAAGLGVPVTGYFVWSLLDNLEWALGYSQRFGIVWVDHSTLERTPKASFRWYRDLIADRTV